MYVNYTAFSLFKYFKKPFQNDLKCISLLTVRYNRHLISQLWTKPGKEYTKITGGFRFSGAGHWYNFVDHILEKLIQAYKYKTKNNNE